MHWVCIKSAPAIIFLARRTVLNSRGSAKGLAAAPINNSGGPFKVSPPMMVPSSRMDFTAWTNWIESRSNTPMACGWFPKIWWSPDRHNTFLIPRADAPKMSDWRAMRFRSLTTICKIGSKPADFNRLQAARLDMRTMAVWLSVTFTASTLPFKVSAFLSTDSGFAPLGGPHSAVTANVPFSITFFR